MPLYVVRHGETERLIEASTGSVAIRHAAKKIIFAHAAKSKEVAALMGRGVQVEVAGTDPDPIPPVPLPKRQSTAPKWAKKGEVQAGDILQADDGFTCLESGSRLTVEADDDGDLYVKCGDGSHHLDGQLNADDEYVGLVKVEA